MIHCYKCQDLIGQLVNSSMKSRSNVEQVGVVEKEKQMRKQEKIRQIVE